jgi:hypothetical protein
VTIQLRYLQALSEISSNQGTTIVFPLPMDVLRPLIEAGTAADAADADGADRKDAPRELPARQPAALP